MDDAVLDRITCEQLLEHLSEEHRVVLELLYGLEIPQDWPWKETSWPPTQATIGWYVGMRFRGKPLSEAAIRYIRKASLHRLAAMVSPASEKQIAADP